MTKPKILITLLILFLFVRGFSQSSFNLGFEKVTSGNSLPVGWFQWGGTEYNLRADSTYSIKGNSSGTVQAPAKGKSFGCIAYKIPNGYHGTTIRLEGYIKTEKIKNGYAGLMLRLDKGNNTVAFDNMQTRGITGSTNWKKYYIDLPFEDVDVIYVAGIVMGEGQAWFDNFKISIDGKNIENLKFKQRIPVKAELDHEFDEGSNFSIKKLNKQHINNLFALCRVWGELKYTHPDIAQGAYNWDYELFRILPIVKNKSFHKELLKWKQSYGDYKKAPLLDHYYIDFVQGAGNPIFKNENPYEQMHFGDDGYRLLALFRYWNMIEYFFPYKHLIKEGWDHVLKEYIPKIVQADDELSYKLTLLELVGEIQDTHANIWRGGKVLDSFFGNKIAPIKIKFIEEKAVVERTYSQLPDTLEVHKGDVLVSMDGKIVADYLAENIGYFPASNYPTQLRNIARKILRTNTDNIELVFSNSKETYTIQVPTFPLKEIDFYKDETPSHKNLSGDIGYIYPGSLKEGEIEGIMQKFMEKKGIVIDFRCYPSDFVVFSLGKYLMPKPTPFVKFKTVDKEKLGAYKFSESKTVGFSVSDSYKGKIAILVNEETQSSAEYHVMAFQVAPKAKVFGSQTAGADGNISKIWLPGNVLTVISGIGVYYPDRTETQQTGVKIDVQVKPSIKAFREGRDEVLEKALVYLSSKE